MYSLPKHEKKDGTLHSMQERGDEDDEIPENKFQDIIDESEPEEINDPSVKQFKMFKCACVELCSFSPDGERNRTQISSAKIKSIIKMIGSVFSIYNALLSAYLSAELIAATILLGALLYLFISIVQYIVCSLHPHEKKDKTHSMQEKGEDDEILYPENKFQDIIEDESEPEKINDCAETETYDTKKKHTKKKLRTLTKDGFINMRSQLMSSIAGTRLQIAISLI